MNWNEQVLERFLRYVRIDTQSDPASETFPSTAKQMDLGRLLVGELLEAGLSDAQMDAYGYVYATLPGNSARTDVPVICYCAHMDTSPDVSGANVRPLVHLNYQGHDIVLPEDTSQIIRPKDHPDLAAQIGNDIVTASGTTLLGADNKAGIAAVMTAVSMLQTDSSLKRGTIKVLFTPDEEIGRGTEHVDLARLGADYAYTIDGETLGSLEDETFSADSVIVEVFGVSTHPGFAFGKMENSIKIAAEIVHNLPADRLSPETTRDREGFLHPVRLEAHQEHAVLELIVRDFREEGLHQMEGFLQDLVGRVLASYPGSSYKMKVKAQYRNMGEILAQHPQVVDFALKAIEETGLTPIRRSIRGGTDGSRLSFMGLPCPNIFAGEHAFHSRQEWVSVQDMEKAAQVMVRLAGIWESEGKLVQESKTD